MIDFSGLNVVEKEIGADYFVRAYEDRSTVTKTYAVTVEGVTTRAIAERLRAGEALQSVASDYGLGWDQMAAAIRFELYSRRTRNAAVLRYVRAKAKA